MNILYMVLAGAAGTFIALQAAANGSFRRNLNDPWWATFFSICGTFTTAIVLMVLFRPAPPSLESIRSAPWWNWIGGPLGSMIVLAGAALVSRLGSAAFIASVVGGQLLCSLILDHYGLMDLAVREVTWGRILGAIMVVLGVLCIKFL